MIFFIFLFWGFLSSILGSILAIFSDLTAYFLSFLYKSIPTYKLSDSVIEIIYKIYLYTPVIVRYIAWIIGVTTGLLIANKYSNGNFTINIVYLIIIGILNLRTLIIFIDERENLMKKTYFENYDVRIFVHDQFYTTAFKNLKYAIILPLIVFSIKPSWATPIFSCVYDLIYILLT